MFGQRYPAVILGDITAGLAGPGRASQGMDCWVGTAQLLPTCGLAVEA